MTQEEKQLLLKDLCARLPYGVIVHSLGIPHEQKLIGYIPDIEKYNIKPYLCPMSSMTEEEKEEIKSYLHSIEGQLIGDNGRHIWYFDYLNAHHFDYRGLIEKGLALEAPVDMYNIK